MAQEQLEKAIGAVFGVIGLAFATLVFKQVGKAYPLVFNAYCLSGFAMFRFFVFIHLL